MTMHKALAAVLVASVGAATFGVLPADAAKKEKPRSRAAAPRRSTAASSVTLGPAGTTIFSTAAPGIRSAPIATDVAEVSLVLSEWTPFR